MPIQRVLNLFMHVFVLEVQKLALLYLLVCDKGNNVVRFFGLIQLYRLCQVGMLQSSIFLKFELFELRLKAHTFSHPYV